jgi:tetratricopeptide (TPR) repeat protein
LIQLELREKRPEAARQRIEKALAARPNDAALLRLAAQTQSSLENPTEAERLLRHAIDANPNDPSTYSMLGTLYFTQQRLDEAIAQFMRLAERQPQSVGVHTSLGTLLQMQNRTDEARSRYEHVLALDPRAAVAANNLAWIYAESGSNLDQALQLAQTAKARLPDRAEVNDTLGWVYVKKGLGALAIPVLRESVRAEPRNAAYHYHLGMAYVGVGDAKQAQAALERALALDPKFDGANAARDALAQLKG